MSANPYQTMDEWRLATNEMVRYLWEQGQVVGIDATQPPRVVILLQLTEDSKESMITRSARTLLDPTMTALYEAREGALLSCIPAPAYGPNTYAVQLFAVKSPVTTTADDHPNDSQGGKP